ncbi:transglutaminaseTgpA domain-containing protein [Bacillus sp. ISL-46]|uniref:transglutaminase TgpA family protein n=1 Tax=Bacillus sp. ISL-46 TaxID=2819129 RepID=UPI001BE69735|nr:transglutaminaseTgpA domain-containing protein [Bacillus sp. ISL-46]MBT2719736.1 transglutaminase domain-containing protein [Bacillus sp. ISL-46]
MIKRDYPSFLLYTFGFLLLWEWLRPVEQLTETEHIETFIIFLIISFALSFLHLKWIWQYLIKMIFILYSINRIHYDEGFFQFSWVKSLLTDVIDNIGLIAARDWNDLSNEFRTLLFFVLLWLMVYLIHYWLLNRKRIFIFYLMTLIYITVLDTFTPYSAKAAIVRTVVAGFAVMGMLTFYRIIQRENVNIEPAFFRKWMVPLARMIAFSVFLGIVVPKAEPIWPDPVPYLTANNDKVPERNLSGVHRIGYGTNDSALGGPFIGDNNPVFNYEANGKSYWKMETKDVYTGKGWLTSGTTPISFRQEDLVPVYSLPKTVETIKESARVLTHVGYNYNYLMYPAGINKVLKILPLDAAGNDFEVDTTNERISFYNHNKAPVVPRVFTVEFETPKYKAKDLVQTTSFDPTSINPEFYEKYTRLPEGLPPRVKELAEEITASKSNWFDKAKAVESYFGKAEFTYDQKNVAVPDTNDDYVDQFLFDTKRGYCDNFSSSMAVMLRTLGIPTRWVKGFTGGDFLQYSDEASGVQVYEVTNNNAHSWVEVFFPNQGWVPFEPTKGFSNEIIINYESTATSSSNPQTSTPTVKKPQQENLNDTKASNDSNQFSDIKRIWTDSKLFLKNNWMRMVLIFILLAGVFTILYRGRGKWVPYLLLAVYRFKKKDESFGAAYLALLEQFDRYGLKRKENQTLRNYARYIDSFFSTREMSRLTAIYENYVYHQNLPKGTWEESHELWENLIKKTIA